MCSPRHTHTHIQSRTQKSRASNTSNLNDARATYPHLPVCHSLCACGVFVCVEACSHQYIYKHLQCRKHHKNIIIASAVSPRVRCGSNRKRVNRSLIAHYTHIRSTCVVCERKFVYVLCTLRMYGAIFGDHNLIRWAKWVISVMELWMHSALKRTSHNVVWLHYMIRTISSNTCAFLVYFFTHFSARSFSHWPLRSFA